MKKVKGNYGEVSVLKYNVVNTYLHSGIKSLLIMLENGEEVRIITPFFSHMQKSSLIEDLEKKGGRLK